MVPWWTSWGYQTVISGIKNANFFHLVGASGGAGGGEGGVQFCKELKDIVLCIPWGGTSTRPQSCTIVSWLLLLCLWTSQVPTCQCRKHSSVPGSERSLEVGIATHSSIPGWRIPMDRGAWQAAVHGVARVRTQLKWLSTHTCTLVSASPAPWLATIWICPLGLKEGHGSWSLFPTNKNRGTKRLLCPGSPHGPAQLQ